MDHTHHYEPDYFAGVLNAQHKEKACPFLNRRIPVLFPAN